ncbi:MAG TPA: hypothetical protein GXZ87_07645 [Bacteroidales bacterium]|nr:hypothetical protein [Bacteroidales bacterium]
MAIQKEIWMNSIVEGLFADNTFLSKAFNADEFVNQGKTVHIQNAGVASKVEKNRTQFPATVKQRTDIDLTFNLDNYSTDPIKIDLAETVELSYNKRESVLKQDKTVLHEAISEGILYEWFPAIANAIRTTGGAVLAHTPSATGNRKAFTKADVKAAMTKFNKDNVPATGRYMLIDADMYDQLIDSLTDKEATAFHAAADIKNGIVGRLFSFDIMMRSRVGVYTTSGSKKLWSTTGAATDNAAGLAWHEDSVCRALGEVIAREALNDPTYYGDIYSFEVRAGGRAMRNDVKGLLAIVQDAAA